MLHLKCNTVIVPKLNDASPLFIEPFNVTAVEIEPAVLKEIPPPVYEY